VLQERIRSGEVVMDSTDRFNRNRVAPAAAGRLFVLLGLLSTGGAIGCADGGVRAASGVAIGTPIARALKDLGEPAVDGPCPPTYRDVGICTASTVRVVEYHRSPTRLFGMIQITHKMVTTLCVDEQGNVVKVWSDLHNLGGIAQ
jgi:hypothetical protein